MPEIYIGCSGYSYQHWRGNFYPEKLSQKKWFAHYGSAFSTVELNVTFYRIPKPETFQHWYQDSAPDFAFAVKGSRFITHRKRLLDPEESLERFFEPVMELKEKMKVVLWQLSPGFKADLERLEEFLERLDRYHVRNTFEFRHESWLSPEVAKICQKHNVAICSADWPPFVDEVPTTSDFVYIRRHGHKGTYNGSYTTEALEADAVRIKSCISRGLDVFIYFNNDIGGAAPRNAAELAEMIGSNRVDSAAAR